MSSPTPFKNIIWLYTENWKVSTYKNLKIDYSWDIKKEIISLIDEKWTKCMIEIPENIEKETDFLKNWIFKIIK